MVEKLEGLNEVIKNLNKEINKIEDRTQAGVTLAAQFVKGEAQSNTPMDLGNLVNSAFVTSPRGKGGGVPEFKGKKSGDMASTHVTEVAESIGRVKGSGIGPVAEVGFSAVYAVAVHENMNPKKSKSTSGGAKFLENALKNNTKKILDIIQKKAKIK